MEPRVLPRELALALLVTTISRQVDQLSFSLSPLETVLGMSSEIISMRTLDGRVKYTGWFRSRRRLSPRHSL